MKQILTALFLFVGLTVFAQQDEHYPINFPKDQNRTRTDRILNGVGLGGVSVAVTDPMKMYNDMTMHSVVAKAGQTVIPAFDYTGRWMHGFVYVDKNQNGRFDVLQPGEHGALTADNDLVSFSGMTFSDGNYNSAGQTVDMGVLTPVAFTLPESLQPGFYMMRYKVDWDSADPAGYVGADNSIIANGGGIADVRLRIYDDPTISITIEAEGGTVSLGNGEPVTTAEWTIGQSLPLVVVPDEGMRLKQISVRHGLLKADSMVNGVAQYVEETFSASAFDHGLVTLDGSIVDGDMEVRAEFISNDSESEDEVYQLIFSDEFNQTDGSHPDPAKWQCSTRYGSTWNRYISNSPDVAFIRNGSLVCRAIKNPDTTTDNVPMITGAMETRNLFSFTYGKVEIRLKALPHTGSFPAAWMMPQPPCASWPNAGEIDIFESIDDKNTAYHTVHSNWTYNLKRTNPTPSSNETVTIGNWHVYGLTWEPDLLTWTVDGNRVATYRRLTTQNAIDGLQWPFDHEFYIILNQSVGDGSWAAKPDQDFTYETEFDYVRVYQKVPTGIIQIENGGLEIENDNIYDLQGRMIVNHKLVNGRLPKGIYIRGGKKIVVR